MRRKIISLLEQIDLRETDIAIYIQLLKKGRATIPYLALKTGFNQMRVYRAVDRLRERGLIETRTINQKQREIIPLSLENLIQKLNNKQKKLRRLEMALRNLDSFLPFIHIDQKEAEETIEIREGLEAFREEYLKIPQICEEEFLCLGSMPNYWQVAGMSYDCPEERTFIRQRLHGGIHARVLNEPCPEAENFRRFDSVDKRITHLTTDLPIKKNYLTITEHQVSHFICDQENPRVIVIRQPDLVELHQLQFQQLWKK